MRRVLIAAAVGAVLAPAQADADVKLCYANAQPAQCQHMTRHERLRHRPCTIVFCPGWKRRHWREERVALGPAVRGMLARLRGCETRGIPFPANYRYAGAHSGSYQYDAATWAQAGGHVFVASAIPAEQDVRTARFFPSHRSQWACQA